MHSSFLFYSEDLRQDTTGAYLEKLEFVLQNYSPSFILCVVPNNRSDRYSGIKKKCTSDRAGNLQSSSEVVGYTNIYKRIQQIVSEYSQLKW